MAKNYLDKTGLALVWEKIKNLLNTKVDKVDGKGLSTNDYTTNEKTKLAGIASGAQVNVLEGIQKNGATITPVNKIANITINKSDVGLGNVDNTSDANKPISTATQTALNGKANSSHTHGNITNTGTLQTTDVPIENGDKLVITDASNSNKIARTSLAFDTLNSTAEGYALSKDGTWREYNNYIHPTYNTHSAGAYKVGNDATGHVIIGDALEVTDIQASDYNIHTDAGVVAMRLSDVLDVASQKTIEGIQFNLNGSSTGSGNPKITRISHYATCTTAATTVQKEAILEHGALTLEIGARIFVKFTNTINATNPTLKIGENEAKPIYYNGAALGKNLTDAGGTYEFVYNGSQWELVGDLDTNSSYTPASATPLMDGTATVGSSVKYAREDHVHPSDTSRVSTSTTVNGKPLSSNITLSASDVSAIPTSAKGTANGVCPLNSSSKIDSTYLPSFVDDVVEAYARSGQTALSSTWLATGSASGTVITPQSGIIYVLMADSGDYTANSQFRWSGTSYVKLNDGGVSPITEAEINTICA